jgi:hypothetical protein
MLAKCHTRRLPHTGWWRPRAERKLPQMVRLFASTRPEGKLRRKESAPAVDKRPLVNLARSRLVRGVSMLIIAAVVVAGTLDVAAPESAAAFSVTSHGSPGSVGVPPATLGYGGYNVNEQLTAPARYIYESVPYAGRDQYVCITHRTWEYDGSWILRDQQSRCGWIRAAYTRIPDGAYTSAYRPMIGTWLAYDVVVTWTLPNGVSIGDKSVRYEVGNGYNMDLRCAVLDDATLTPTCNARYDIHVLMIW